jgi:hypothetical protein
MVWGVPVVTILRWLKFWSRRGVLRSASGHFICQGGPVARVASLSRLIKVSCGALFLAVTVLRCACCRQRSEQNRASLRLPLNFSPQVAQIVGGVRYSLNALRLAYHFRCLALSRSYSSARRLSHSALQGLQ